MFVGITHDSEDQILTITIREDKVVQLMYANLPPGWELVAPSYEGFVVDYLNGLIEQRYDRKSHWQSKGIKPNNPEYDATELTSERWWLDTATDELVFMDCVVTGAMWIVDIQQYIINVRNTSHSIERVS